MLPWSLRAFAATSIPVGLELYSVRNALKDDLSGTVLKVAQMGYQCVEFYAPYFEWTEPQTKEMKKTSGRSGHPLLLHPQQQHVFHPGQSQESAAT